MLGASVGLSMICLATAVAADERVVIRKIWITWKAKYAF
jgi:hypothetical protein